MADTRPLEPKDVKEIDTLKNLREVFFGGDRSAYSKNTRRPFRRSSSR